MFFCGTIVAGKPLPSERLRPLLAAKVYTFNLNDFDEGVCEEQVQRAALLAARSIQVWQQAGSWGRRDVRACSVPAPPRDRAPCPDLAAAGAAQQDVHQDLPHEPR